MLSKLRASTKDSYTPLGVFLLRLASANFTKSYRQTNRTMIRTWFIALLLHLGMPPLIKGQNTLNFEQLSTQQGLSQSTVRSICQDKEGFMWFGTHDGLNKYDGYSFTVFRPDPHDLLHTLHHNIITDIHEDRQGRLWTATLGGGLHEIDKRTGNVTAYEIGQNRENSWNTLFTIHEDAKGSLWMATGGGLARFDPPTKHYTLYPKQKYLVAITQESSGQLWVGGIQGVNQFDQIRGTFTEVKVDTLRAHQPFISSLLIDNQRILWAGSLEGGVWRMDTKRHPLQFTRYNPQGVINKAIRYNGIYADKAGYIWLATGEGLQRIDPKTDQVITYGSEALLPGSLSNNSIQSLFQDRTGALWVGTNNGVNKTPAFTKAFNAYQIIPSLPSISLNNNYINTLLEDQTGSIWLGNNAGSMDGSFQHGLFQLKSDRGQIKPDEIITFDHTESLSGQKVWTLYEDSQKQLWAGTDKGLYLYKRTTGRFMRFSFPLAVRCIVEDRYGKLWLASASAGDSAVIAALDLKHAHFTYYRYEKTNTAALNNPFIYQLLASRSGDIYAATGGGGINRLNQKTGRFTQYQPNYQYPVGHMNDKEVRCLYEDAQGIIWAGTGLGGLNRLDPNTGRVLVYTTHEGLPSNRILSITGDNKGNLWLGTARGLSRFNLVTRRFRNYEKGDGLPDNEFNTGSVHSRQSKLLFGTRNGFLTFYPDSIKDNTMPPPVYITSLSVLAKKRIIPKRQLTLSYKENFVTFEFVALNYQMAEKNQYAFQLVGLDKDWVYSNNRRFASYTNLAPGNYIFRVKAANNDGVWNQTGASLHIYIKPPWWQTTWFRLTALLSLLLAAGLAIRYYTQTRLRRQRADLKRVLQVQEEERQRLAADLHDDLGATLSAIKGQLETLPHATNGLRKPIGLMEKAIRDLRFIAHNLMPPEFSKLGLTETLREAIGQWEASGNAHFLFVTYGEQRRLELETELIIYRIAVELINNTLKHARAQNITVQLIFRPEQLSLMVEDDGLGYPPPPQLPAGAGLRNIRSRASYLNADFVVDSGPKGTTVTLTVPH